MADESIVVAYHYPCPDGIFGAFAAHLHFAHRGIAVRWAPLNITQPEQERIDVVAASLTARDTLFIVDFTGGARFIAACCARAKRVVVLDHHKTGEEDLKSPALAALANLEAHFDMQQSGATMARDHFGVRELLANAADRDALLHLFALIEDNDLWRHALPDCKLFAAGFAELKLDLDARNDNGAIFARLRALDVNAVIELGRQVAAANEAVFAANLAAVFEVEIPIAAADGGAATSFRTLAVRTERGDLRSELGNRLAALSASRGLAAAGIVVYVDAGLPDGVLKCSARSIGDVDTTSVSRAYGGGGHKNASSFNVAAAALDQWRVQVAAAEVSGPG